MAVTLLLADDSVTIQRVIELTFADEHVRVICASDGQQAIQRIDAERPDIVLADVGMPRVDGYGVAAHVKQTPALRHIPVLLLTGAFEPIDEGKARATGCDGILVKPFKPEQLIERVRELLAGQRSTELWPADMPRVDPPAAPAPPPPPVFVAPPPPVFVAPPPPPAPVVRTTVSIVPPPSAPVLVPPPAPRPAPRTVHVGAASADAPTSTQQDMLRPANRNPQPQPLSRTQLVQRDLPPPADAFESELDMLDVALGRLEPTASPHVLDAATASDFARDLAALRSEPADELPEATAPTARAGASADASEPAPFGTWDLPDRYVSGSRPTATNEEFGRADAFDRMDAFDLTQDPIDIVPIELPAEAPPAPAPTLVFITPPPAPPPAPVSPPVIAKPPAPVFVAPPAPVFVPPAPVATPAPPPTPTPMPPAPVAAPAPVPRPSLANAFSALLAAEQAQPPARALAASATLSEAAIEDVVKRVLARMTDEAVHKVVLDAAERIIREEIDHLKSSTGSGPANP